MIYRDKENGIVMGVCAGIANSFDLNLTGVRIVTFVALLFSTWTTLLVYFLAGFLLRNRPLHFDHSRERQFWYRSGGREKRKYAYSRNNSYRG